MSQGDREGVPVWNIHFTFYFSDSNILKERRTLGQVGTSSRARSVLRNRSCKRRNGEEGCWEKEEVVKIDHLDVAAVPKTTNGAVVRKTHVVARLVSRVRLKIKKWELDQLDKVSKKRETIAAKQSYYGTRPQWFEEFMLVVLNSRLLADEDIKMFKCFWMFKCL